MFEQLSRRELGKIALGGALGATALGWSRSSSAQEQNTSTVVRPQPPGIKLGCVAPVNPTDDDLLFFKQLGVDTVSIFPVYRGEAASLPSQITAPPEYNSVEGLLSIKKRYAAAGLMVHEVNSGVTNEDVVDIVLNGPGRDKRIEAYKTRIRNLGNAGLSYALSTYNPTMAMSSGLAEVRGSMDRDLDLNSSELTGRDVVLTGVKGSANSLVFGREYSRDEIWANYTYFIKQVAPIAEEEGVSIGFHPDDPPVPSIFGVPRIFSTFDDCKKALKIANSPNVGMCLCCGTWAEGGAAMGIDPAGAIRYFGSQKQIAEVHFRNVSSPLPHFHETFVDMGYYDMYKIMTALVDIKYDGVVQLDHSSPMVGGLRTYEAFALGYMRAMLQAAQTVHSA